MLFPNEKVLIKHNPHGIHFELASMTPRVNEIADDEPDAKQTWVWDVTKSAYNKKKSFQVVSKVQQAAKCLKPTALICFEEIIVTFFPVS